MRSKTAKAKQAPRSPASGYAVDLETVAGSPSGRIPKVQPNMAAKRSNTVLPTTREEEITDAATREYIDRSKADLETLKGKRGDAPMHLEKSREAIGESREVLAQAITKRPS